MRRTALVLAALLCGVAVLAASTLRDDFNRGNGSLGAAWTTAYGIDWVVYSNAAAVSTTGGYTLYTAYTPSADHVAGVTLTVSTAGSYIGPAVRVSTNQSYAVTGAVGSSLLLLKQSSGTPTTLVTYGVAPALSDVITLSVSGSTLKVYKNGTQVGSDYTDASSPYTSGGCGMSRNGASGSQVDDFTCDDVGGGGGSDPSGLLLRGIGAALWRALWPFGGQPVIGPLALAGHP